MEQGSLFSSAENGAPGAVARVAVELPLSGAFDYTVPSRLRDRIRPGVRVWISFSRRRVMGICLGLKDSASVAQPLEILDAVDDAPLLSPALLTLVEWISAYYHCTLGDAFGAVLPAVARKGSGPRRVRMIRLAVPAEEALSLADALLEKHAKQARLLRLLAESESVPLTVVELCERAHVSRSPVDTLVRRGLVRFDWTDADEAPSAPPAEPFPRPERLSAEQRTATDRIAAAIRGGARRDFLLYGVTGSGKTEVYLRAIEEVIARGKSAIVLVPEISLTPQTIARFKGRFDRVAVLHSRLTDKDRLAQWKRIQAGEADVVVGARSAVFAPLPNLGLVVVDEEHENSFKQQGAPYYHARSVALKRAELEGAFVILGSATPSLESLLDAREGRLDALALRQRVGGRRFPLVSMVDMRLEKRARGSILSHALIASLGDVLRRRKQAILFLNRRGYFPVLFCPACNAAVRCSQCDISLTLHRKANRLICHYCGFEQRPPSACPACKAAGLRFLGAGTERVEHEIQAIYPEARVLRMDSDTMLGRDAHEKALDRFRRGEVDVLVGTQMIAKGLDFPEVTLVGVIAADLPLYQPDFRSAERTYQLLSQVSGRAGRGEEEGRVIVQTSNLEHYSILCAVKNDYLGFAEQELVCRRMTGYPPYGSLLRVVLSSRDPDAAAAAAASLGEALRAEPLDGATLLGPAPAPIGLINGRHRWHFLVKSPERAPLDEAARRLKTWYPGCRGRKGGPSDLRMVLDPDPLSML